MSNWKEIRQQVLVNGMSQRAACAKYRLGWHTLKMILAHVEPPVYRQCQARPRRVLAPMLPVIHEILEADGKAPWKPAEVEQRDGRILRQGNENEEVAIYRYVTEGSFDAYMWQALETKARFIGQVITGDNAARRAEDIGGQELSYAEVKAIASGNPTRASGH